jgi:hypothetical protein
MKRLIILSAAACLLLPAGEARSRDQGEAVRTEFPELKGEYFGQLKPGPKAEPFAVQVLSARSDHYIRSITFSPDGTEAYWPVIDLNDNYRRWIVGSRMVEGTWMRPELAPFSKKGYEDDVPCISPGGDKLLFISRRPLKQGDAVGKENIWIMTRDGEGWSDPVPLPEAVNALYTIHQQVSLDGEDNLYFSGEGPGGYGELDIYCSRYADGEYQQPKNLGPVINGPEGDYTPFIGADGSYLIFTRNIGERWTLLISFRDRDGAWTSPADLREIIEGVAGMDLGNPFVTHDGRYLIFFGERDGGITPFWTDTSFIEELRDKR